MQAIRVIFSRSDSASLDALIQARGLWHEAKQRAEASEKLSRKAWASKLWSVRSRAIKHGYEHGKKRAEVELGEKLLEYHRNHKTLLHDSEKECLALALRIAEEVIGQEVRSSPSTLLQRIRRGLAALRDMRRVRIEVHPDDFKALKKELSSLVDEMAGEVCPSEKCDRGAAIIISPLGRLELLISEHLKAITSDLQCRLAQQQND